MAVPKPLTWNSPKSVWNKKGIFWNGMEPATLTMRKIKAIIDFSGYAGPELSPVALEIHDKMSANAATFDTPPVAMAAFLILLGTFNSTLAAKASRSTDDIAAFNNARTALEDALGDLGNYVNSKAKGNGDIVLLSGFPSYGGDAATPGSTPGAPTDLRLRHGDDSGIVVARYRVSRAHSSNEVQVTTGDPNNEAGWVAKGSFSGGKAILEGLTVGSTIWVRVRTVTGQNQHGPWSDPAKITVI